MLILTLYFNYFYFNILKTTHLNTNSRDSKKKSNLKYSTNQEKKKLFLSYILPFFALAYEDRRDDKEAVKIQEKIVFLVFLSFSSSFFSRKHIIVF